MRNLFSNQNNGCLTTKKCFNTPKKKAQTYKTEANEEYTYYNNKAAIEHKACKVR